MHYTEINPKLTCGTSIIFLAKSQCFEGAVQRWSMSGARIVNVLLLVGVKFHPVPPEGLMGVP